MRLSLPFCLAGLLAAAPLAAQAPLPPDSLLDRLVGHWVLQGPMAGLPQVTHDVTFEWVLDREYMRMHEVSRERTPAGGIAYEAIVYLMWDPGSRQYAVFWLDNTAKAPFPPEGVGHAPAAGDSIPFLFRTSATDLFHNTFVYDRASDTWQWHMDNDQNGVRRPFARVTLTRQR